MDKPTAIATGTKILPPMPPHEFRVLVGPTEDRFFDNPYGSYIFPEIPPELYDSIFDFGSGCGRQARQLMQQPRVPNRYVGIDIHRGMVEWCQANIATVDARFQFFHHDVYNPTLAPGNSAQLTAPFPVGDGEFTIVNAHSVFTHIYEHQTEFYLSEIARILKPGGVARTTWFFFDRRGYPMLQDGQNSLFVNWVDPTNAVIFDLQWFLSAIKTAGLAVKQTIFPGIPGFQWLVFLEHRTSSSVDHFPSAEECAKWISGAIPGQPDRALMAEQKAHIESLQASIDDLRLEVKGLRESLSWKLTGPGRALMNLFK